MTNLKKTHQRFGTLFIVVVEFLALGKNNLLLAAPALDGVVERHAGQKTESSRALSEKDEEGIWAPSKYREAITLLKAKRWEESVVLFRRYLKEEPGSMIASLFLVDALIHLGRRADAIQVLNQVSVNQNGEAKNTLQNRMQSLTKLFLTQETFQIYQMGAHALVEGDLETALSQFQKALGSEPDNVEILLRLGQTHVLLGEIDTASEYLKKAKDLYPFHPGEPEIRIWLGRCYQQKGQFTAAAEELESAHKTLPRSERTVLWLVDTYVAQGKRAEALKLLETDVASEPFHLLSLLRLAKLRRLQKPLLAKNQLESRKSIQLVWSRLQDYDSIHRFQFESAMGLPVSNSAKIEKEVMALMSRIDADSTP